MSGRAKRAKKLPKTMTVRRTRQLRNGKLFDDPQFARFKELRRELTGKVDDPSDIDGYGEEGT